MARLWRISNYADLSGKGGLLASGRWHNFGRPVLYTADSSAGAMIEMLVHSDGDDMPETFQLLEIEIENSVVIAQLPLTDLRDVWPSDEELTRAIGDGWLASAASLALRVPSVIVPDAWNVLINPAHPDAGRIKIINAQHVPLDARLK